MPRRIWVVLINATDGKAYKGINASKVSVATSADVDDLRRAVKAEFANALSSVDAATLTPYKNKAAFDAKNAPLTSSRSVAGLGKSEDEAVVMVVPASAPFFNMPMKTTCNIPFFNAVLNATIQNQWLMIGHSLPSLPLTVLHSRLLQRYCIHHQTRL